MNARRSGGATVTVVTGGRSGLGAAVAASLAGRGCAVIATSRRAPSRRRRPAPGRVVPWSLDVRRETSVTSLFADLDRLGLEIETLVNNAGLGVFSPVLSTSAARFRDVVATNLTGAFLCAKEALVRMAARGGGRIVNIGSIASEAALPDCAAYAASKAGLAALSDALRLEGRAHGVLVTHVVLGAVATGIWDGREGFDLRKMLSPGDVGARIAELVAASDAVAVEELRLMPPAGILEPEP